MLDYYTPAIPLQDVPPAHEPSVAAGGDAPLPVGLLTEHPDPVY